MTSRPRRLWPGIVIAAIVALLRFVVPAFEPEALIYGVIAGAAGFLLIVLWWAFFSRAPIAERVGAILVMAPALAATPVILDKSIATGAMGMLFYISVLPVMALVFVAWAALSQRWSGGLRWVSMAGAILLTCGAFALLRTDGIGGEGLSQWAWRWTPTHEEQLLEKAAIEPTVALPPPPAPVVDAPKQPVPEKTRPVPEAVAAAKTEPEAVWPGFRGPDRDSVVRGVRIKTDWSASPPAQLWRRPVGPGWSSFAVQGDLVYTQEQRGEEEIVACYRLTTGEPVWAHRDAARFWESNAGAGPRGTPMLSRGRVYAFGGTGILNALDARTGSVVWTHNAAADSGRKTPGWGFSSSPLVLGDSVIVAASGQLVSYDAATGAPRWFGPVGKVSYSSPHRMTSGGVTQLLLASGGGLASVNPADGKLVWEHQSPGSNMLQPVITPDGDLLVSNNGDAGGSGIRRIALRQGPDGWTFEERWNSTGLKPYFNDFVTHEGYAFGFDGRILSCINLQDGKRVWKGGRYGNGQMLLLSDQDVLLVLSEEGELALVGARPGEFSELARFKAIEGKTWNHPALAGDVLLVRNGEEMAAFRLAREGK